MPDETPKVWIWRGLRPGASRSTFRSPTTAFTAELIAGRAVDLTYTVTTGRGTWVLRRPPLGHVLPTSTTWGREYRVIRARGAGVPVPRTGVGCARTSTSTARRST